MAKKKKTGPRRRASAAGVGLVTGMGLGYGLGRYTGRVLNMLPAGFESYAKGKGKGPTENTRVRIAAGATLACYLRKPWRKYAPFAAFLLGSAIKQHRVSYEADEDAEDFVADLGVEVPGKADDAKQQKKELEVVVEAAWAELSK